ncbi:hypothetical protein AO262_33140 [Pseudomonas fluorescens ABAC62]|nr:hypothetical protein AO262_33140 [Pseudomonas fluorescens ABAC62]
MNKRDLEQKILAELEARRNGVLNRNAINALYLENMETASKAQGVVIDGLIETTAFDVQEVVGVHIDRSAHNTRLASGTHIKTEATGAQRLTGLQVGVQTQSKELK